ncbi:hypothetical protein ACFX1S_028944 [Malus domestica]
MAASIGIGHLGCSLASPSSFSAIVVNVYRLVQYDISGAPSGSRVANFNHHAGYLNFVFGPDLSRTVFIIPLSSSDKHSAGLPPSTFIEVDAITKAELRSKGFRSIRSTKLVSTALQNPVSLGFILLTLLLYLMIQTIKSNGLQNVPALGDDP